MKWIQRLNLWLAERRLKQAIWAMNILIQAKDPRVYEPVHKAAQRRAHELAMAWLDSRRIHHCRDCSTTDQLLSIGGYYYCKVHAELIGKKEGLVKGSDEEIKRTAEANGLTIAK